MDEIESDLLQSGKKRKSRDVYSSRPEIWREIVVEFISNGEPAALAKFPSAFTNEKGELIKPATYKQRLRRWKKDYELEMASGQLSSSHKQMPPYGEEIDVALAEECKVRIASGLSIDPSVIRSILLRHLEKVGQLGLLREKGGKYVFGQTWAYRFYNRHNISYKLISREESELPSEFEDMKTVFVNILSHSLFENKVPPELVVNCDEINIQFVPRNGGNSDTSRCKKGSRIRVLEIGQKNPQLTVTLAITETGHILHPQMIFAGKTKRTLCTVEIPPQGWLYSKNQTNAQETNSFLEYIEYILVPYKNLVISTHNLPSSQRMVIILDLHPSHFSPDIIDCLRKHHILPMFTPRGCADRLQVCALAAQKPFKLALKQAFRQYAHRKLDEHIARGEDPNSFHVKVTIGFMKPLITDFVRAGLDHLQSPEMKERLVECFQTEGLLAEARSDRRVQTAALTRDHDLEMHMRHCAVPVAREDNDACRDDDSDMDIDLEAQDMEAGDYSDGPSPVYRSFTPLNQSGIGDATGGGGDFVEQDLLRSTPVFGSGSVGVERGEETEIPGLSKGDIRMMVGGEVTLQSAGRIGGLTTEDVDMNLHNVYFFQHDI